MAFTVACPHCFTPNRLPGPLRQRKVVCSACRRSFVTEEGLLYSVQRLGGRRRLLWIAGLLLLAVLGALVWRHYPALVAFLSPSENRTP